MNHYFSEIAFRDILILLTRKRGETSVVFFCRKTNSSIVPVAEYVCLYLFMSYTERSSSYCLEIAQSVFQTV